MKNTYKNLEKIVRGFSNHRRIQIMDLLNKKPSLSVFEISEELDTNFKTVSAHIRRLAGAGLVVYEMDMTSARYKLTHRGKKVILFLRTVE